MIPNIKSIVFGGSFRPLHEGHLKCIDRVKSHFAESDVILQRIQHPYYKDSSTADNEKVLSLPFIHLDDHEGALYYFLEKNNLLNETTLYCCGSDHYKSLQKWKNFAGLVTHINFYFFNRPSDLNLEKLDCIGLAHSWGVELSEIQKTNEYRIYKNQYGCYWFFDMVHISPLSSTLIRNGEEQELSPNELKKWIEHFSN